MKHTLEKTIGGCLAFYLCFIYSHLWLKIILVN